MLNGVRCRIRLIAPVAQAIVLVIFYVKVCKTRLSCCRLHMGRVKYYKRMWLQAGNETTRRRLPVYQHHTRLTAKASSVRIKCVSLLNINLIKDLLLIFSTYTFYFNLKLDMTMTLMFRQGGNVLISSRPIAYLFVARAHVTHTWPCSQASPKRVRTHWPTSTVQVSSG